MQHSPSEIKEKLLGALDKDYNVVDMATVFDVVSTLEKIHITKEALEKTRLGKYINELRRKTNNEHLARRIKDLVKSWRKLIPQTENSALNGEKIAGGITPPGPGPGSGPRINSASVSNRLCGLTPNSRFKPASPTVSYERLASPLSLSASNSPLLQPSSKTTGGNRPVTPNSYAPIRVPTNHRQPTVLDERDSPMPGQPNSGLHAISNVFKPVSPALQAVKQSMTTNRSSTPNSNSSPVACPKPNSPVVVTSSKSPYNNGGRKSLPKSCASSNDNSFPTNTTPSMVADESVHSRLSIAKTNPANKRLRKNQENEDDNDSVNGVPHPLKKPNTVSENVNGLDSSYHDPHSDKVRASECSAFESVKSSSLEDAAGKDIFKVHSTEVIGNINNANEASNSASLTSPVIPIVKKKRGRKSIKKSDPHDILKEKIGLATTQGSGFQKVKTTQQLIEDLQAKNVVTPGSLKVSTPPTAAEPFKPQTGKHRSNSSYPFPSSDAETTKAKSELMDRFLKSTSGGRAGPSILPELKYEDGDGNIHDKTTRTLVNQTPSKVNEEINKILSVLPKVDPSVLDIDNEDEELPHMDEQSVEITQEDVRRVAVDEWDYVNGMRDHDGQWQEWQDTTTRASQNGDLLHILPYVNIDW